MTTFAAFLSPEEAITRKICTPALSLLELLAMAHNNESCNNCGEHVWRLANCGLCFSCTTGQLNASDDYEVGEPYV